MAGRNHFNSKAGGFIERDHNQDGIDRRGFRLGITSVDFAPGRHALAITDSSLGQKIALCP